MNNDYFEKVGKGELSIGRVLYNDRDDYIRIALLDSKSSVEFLSVEISLENFAKCITGMANCPVQFGIRATDKIGKQLEVKHEVIEVPDDHLMRESPGEIEKALAPYEVDGWKGRSRDALNFHNRVSENKYKVCFFRWVDSEEKN